MRTSIYLSVVAVFFCSFSVAQAEESLELSHSDVQPIDPKIPFNDALKHFYAYEKALSDWVSAAKESNKTNLDGIFSKNSSMPKVSSDLWFHEVDRKLISSLVAYMSEGKNNSNEKLKVAENAFKIAARDFSNDEKHLIGSSYDFVYKSEKYSPIVKYIYNEKGPDFREPWSNYMDEMAKLAKKGSPSEDHKLAYFESMMSQYHITELLNSSHAEKKSQTLLSSPKMNEFMHEIYTNLNLEDLWAARQQVWYQ